MKRHFLVDFNDMKLEEQENLAMSVAETLKERYQTEGEEFMKREWHVKPNTWQEAYCREMAIDSNLWSRLDENGPEFKEIGWSYLLDNHAEEEARQRLEKAFRYLELEVEI